MIPVEAITGENKKDNRVKYEIISSNVTQLATKLGVAPDKLYAAMLKKAKTDWINPAVQAVVVFVMLFILWGAFSDFLTSFYMPPPREKEIDQSGTVIGLAISISIVATILLIAFVVLLFDAIQKFIDGKVSPEATALEHLLNDH